MKRIKVTTRDVMIYSLYMMIAIIGYMFLFTFIGRPAKSAIVTTVSNQTTYYLRCSCEHSEFETALFTLEAVLLMMGARMCWAVKDAPDSVNESGYIALGKT